MRFWLAVLEVRCTRPSTRCQYSANKHHRPKLQNGYDFAIRELWIDFETLSTSTGVARFSQPYMRRRVDSQLLVDGSILARHLTTNSVTTNALGLARHRDWTVKPMHRLVRPVDFERPSGGCQAWSIQAGP